MASVDQSKYAHSHEIRWVRHKHTGCNIGTMDDSSTDDPLLDMIESVARDVLAQSGDDPDARFRFFKRFVELAREIAHAPASEVSTSCR